ncbi:CPCC family cysteine-rich protein [Ktedonobacter robiniae]|uniref:CPCC family cysteine-rich protein n=1 Tax=Ktedonobacter robiniae TaxID=2778365 RepID=UPI0019163D77
MNTKKFACYCCGFLTLEEDPWGSYEICDVCFWEQTHTQVDNPESLGPNRITLQEAHESVLQWRDILVLHTHPLASVY